MPSRVSAIGNETVRALLSVRKLQTVLMPGGVNERLRHGQCTADALHDEHADGFTQLALSTEEGLKSRPDDAAFETAMGAGYYNRMLSSHDGQGLAATEKLRFECPHDLIVGFAQATRSMRSSSQVVLTVKRTGGFGSSAWCSRVRFSGSGHPSLGLYVPSAAASTHACCARIRSYSTPSICPESWFPGIT